MRVGRVWCADIMIFSYLLRRVVTWAMPKEQYGSSMNKKNMVCLLGEKWEGKTSTSVSSFSSLIPYLSKNKPHNANWVGFVFPYMTSDVNRLYA